jgi:hypothetical protein
MSVPRQDEGDPGLALSPGGTTWEEIWRITTRAGSLYVVALDSAGDWWMDGRNVPNPASCALPPQFWRIEPPQPWPPRLGAPVMLMALSSLDREDPARAPGGGKVTSDVSIIEQLAPVPGDAVHD